jgi:hypothetical protein
MKTKKLIQLMFQLMISISFVIANEIPKESLKIDADSFFDPKADYATFSGRVTDKDESGTIVKVSSENKNTKFFRASDPIFFKVQSFRGDSYCKGSIRSIEENYFVMFVQDFRPCFPTGEYFRRGTALIFNSEKLSMRVKEASVYRASLIKKKRDYLVQLNSINQNIFGLEEKKIQMAAIYDQKIAEIEALKVKALDRMLAENTDHIRLQRELAFRLDGLDKELGFYRIDKEEPLFDRWHLDQDLGYPTHKRPVPQKEKASN